MKNDRINQEDLLKLQLPAEMIPDDARVTKRTGDEVFTFKHSIKIYPYLEKNLEGKVTEIEGLFIISSRGSISQVKADTVLCWQLTAEDLVDTLQASWDLEQEQ